MSATVPTGFDLETPDVLGDDAAPCLATNHAEPGDGESFSGELGGRRAADRFVEFHQRGQLGLPRGRDGRRLSDAAPVFRLAIVNRGEPAMRVIHAVRELNAQRDEPIRVIALYTEPERDAMFVRHADEALLPRPATATASTSTTQRYLDARARAR